MENRPLGSSKLSLLSYTNFVTGSYCSLFPDMCVMTSNVFKCECYLKINSSVLQRLKAFWCRLQAPGVITNHTDYWGTHLKATWLESISYKRAKPVVGKIEGLGEAEPCWGGSQEASAGPQSVGVVRGERCGVKGQWQLGVSSNMPSQWDRKMSTFFYLASMLIVKDHFLL